MKVYATTPTRCLSTNVTFAPGELPRLDDQPIPRYGREFVAFCVCVPRLPYIDGFPGWIAFCSEVTYEERGDVESGPLGLDAQWTDPTVLALMDPGGKELPMDAGDSALIAAVGVAIVRELSEELFEVEQLKAQAAAAETARPKPEVAIPEDALNVIVCGMDAKVQGVLAAIRSDAIREISAIIGGNPSTDMIVLGSETEWIEALDESIHEAFKGYPWELRSKGRSKR